jgi:MarR family transcriptional regulator, temperature-dependent positive regulator of motility
MGVTTKVTSLMYHTIDACLLHLLHRASQVANSAFSEELATEDLTPRQFIVLSVLDKDVGLSQTGVVTRTGIDRSTMTDVLRRLARRGFIIRQRSNCDARAMVITITHAGQKALEYTNDKARRAELRLLSKLTPQCGSELYDTLRRLIHTDADRTAL